jgi:hypothetical protein
MTSPEMVFGHVTPADWEDRGAGSHSQSLPEPPTQLPGASLMHDSEVARFRLASQMIV